MSAVGVLLKKELIDSLRDRRTLLTMVLLPILLYPGMMALVGFVMAAGQERLAREELTVAVVGDDAEAFLRGQPPPAHTSYRRLTRAEAERALGEKKVWAVVDAPEGSHQEVSRGRQAHLTVLYTKRHDRSMEALERVRRVLASAAVGALKLRLAGAKLPETFAEPLKTEEVDVDFQKDLGPLVASRVLPVLLVVMLLMSALYPAVDATAGEKERGTLETLLAAPVHPLQVMAAKYLSVSVIATLATLVNLTAMAISFGIGFRFHETVARMAFGPGQISVLLLCLVPASFLSSGVALAVASLARSFKDAQNLLTPVALLAMVPGLLTMMPGIELNAWTAAIPLLNVALLVKATVLGTAGPLHVLITLASVLACSAGAVALAARAFQSERLRFGGAQSWRDLLRPSRPR
ncbi:MAG: ABC transporter permease [Myxococcales bacterium]|nr:ABC transporter permease [Myxococcales bacterium]